MGDYTGSTEGVCVLIHYLEPGRLFAQFPVVVVPMLNLKPLDPKPYTVVPLFQKCSMGVGNMDADLWVVSGLSQ